jgi:molybdate transport system ATP-binding protein
MAAIRLDVSVPRRDFELRVALDCGDETVAIVGPSGAGKSTLLRAIAGLEDAEGTIEVDGEDWTRMPPERRRVGFVFQEYALFPHLSVRANVEFGGPIGDLLDRLGIGHLADAKPGRLSGGERQRVAIARALARRPKLLLLDEPLAALDPHTRDTVRAELRTLLTGSGLPVLLVTHDYVDAAALADRVGVLVKGELVQLGHADELLASPASGFVARFAGGNVLQGRAQPAGDLTEVLLAGGARVVSTDTAEGDVAAVVYPWEVTVAREVSADSAQNHIRAPVTAIVTLGNRVRLTVGPVTAEVTGSSAERLGLREGEIAVATWKATATRLVPI